MRIACAKRARKRSENTESWKRKGDRRRAASAECSVNLCHAVGNEGIKANRRDCQLDFSLVFRYYEIFVRLARPHKHIMEFDATRTACFRCGCGCRFHHTIKSFSVHENSHTIIAWLSQQSKTEILHRHRFPRRRVLFSILFRASSRPKCCICQHFLPETSIGQTICSYLFLSARRLS